jgi:hypothetical protein
VSYAPQYENEGDVREKLEERRVSIKQRIEPGFYKGISSPYCFSDRKILIKRNLWESLLLSNRENIVDFTM